MPFTLRPFRRFHGMAFVVCLLSLISIVGADSLWSGTWVLRKPPQGGHLRMTVEEVGSGWKLTYKVVGPDTPGTIYSPVLTQLDGKEVPVLVNGKSLGQTMAIKKFDSRHTVTDVTFQGKEMAISKSEISPDGKVLKVETDYADPNPTGLVGKQIQYWEGGNDILGALPMSNDRPKRDSMSIEEATISNIREIAAIVEVLERMGLCTRQDRFDIITKFRRKNPRASIPETAFPEPYLLTETENTTIDNILELLNKHGLTSHQSMNLLERLG